MLAAAGVPSDRIRFRYGLDARYLGQGNELTIWVGDGEQWPATDAEVVERFESDYRRIYGLTIPDVTVEAVTWRLSAYANADTVEPVADVGEDLGKPHTFRTVRFDRMVSGHRDARLPADRPRPRATADRAGDRRGAGDDHRDSTGLDRRRCRRRFADRREEQVMAFDPIELEVLWQSLIATVNEQARALQRAAFSPIVREAGDLANAVFDQRGRMVAQAVTGTPGHINSLARAATAVLEEYPPESLVEGDVLITNDPYKTAGQLLDVTVLYPVFRGGKAIAFFGSTIHHTDVGGYGIGAGARDVFEEGLWIPICKLMNAGQRNADVWRFILSNVRQPDHMSGDLHAQMASGEVGAQRLLSLCYSTRARRHRGVGRRDHRAQRSGDTSDHSRAAGRHVPRQRRARPRRRQSHRHRLRHHGRSGAGEILVDYAGSSGASPYGINVVKNYTHAYTTFAVRSVLNPELPNNHGSLAPILVEAPVGSIVNAVSPQPCTARHVVGMFLPNALLKALAQIKPEQAMAEGSGAVWTMQVSGNHDDGRPFITAMFTYAGGVGARAHKPGTLGVLLPHRCRCRSRRGGRGLGPHPVPSQVAARRQRRRRPADRWDGPDRRIQRRHHATLAVERRHLTTRRPTRRHLRW